MPAEASLREFEEAKTPRTRKYKAAVFAYKDQLNYTRLYIGPHRKGQPNVGEFPTPADAIAVTSDPGMSAPEEMALLQFQVP